MVLAFLANLEYWVGPVAGAMVGLVLAVGLYLASRPNRRAALLLKFMAGAAGAWSVVCLTYAVAAPAERFADYLRTGRLATAAIAGFGTVVYLAALFTFEPGERQWRRSSALLVSITLMGSAFVRAAYQPSVALLIQAPLALIFIATVWRFRAEPLVYLSILGVAVTVIFGTRNHLAIGSPDAVQWVASTGAAVSLLMVLIAATLSLKREQAFNVKWYRQGLLIVPLVVSSLAAVTSGYTAMWEGAGWHTAWSLGAWWAVLLVSSLGLKQPDLFGFSCVGAALAAVASYAALGGAEISGYWGRYPSVLLVIALGATVLAALLGIGRRGPKPSGFPRALYLASVAITLAAIVLEPLETRAKYLGADLLIAAGILAMAHAHRAPAWVNYLVAALATGGVSALAHLGPDTPPILWHRRFIQVAAAAAVTWLLLALAVREFLRRAASDRMARRQTEPFTVFGMVAVLVLAVYLGVQQVRTYTEFLTTGQSGTLPLLGPFWGLMGWLAVLLAFLVSMWLVRHTGRTVLFYVCGIMATAYLGLFNHTQDLYNYLIYCVAGYGSSHLIVYLFEARSMAILSRTCALYREERRASTTIFTLAFASCFVGAILALFRLSFPSSLVMLGVMSAVFLAWSFVWLRGEMLYPAVFMATLFILAVWHNVVQPTEWDANRLYVNAMVMALSALAWLVVGNQLHAIRGEIFQLAGPARHCSIVLGLVGAGFAAVLAVSPTFPGDVWRTERTGGDWALGLATFVLLTIYFAWARRVFERRFFSIMSGLAVLLLGLYVGIYTGIRFTTHIP